MAPMYNVTDTARMSRRVAVSIEVRVELPMAKV